MIDTTFLYLEKVSSNIFIHVLPPFFETHWIKQDWLCDHRFGTIHWYLVDVTEDGGFLCPRIYQWLIANGEKWGLMNPLLTHPQLTVDRPSVVQAHYKQPYLLWDECIVCVMFRQQHLTACLPVFQILHYFYLLFCNFPWAIEGGVGHKR